MAFWDEVNATRDLFFKQKRVSEAEARLRPLMPTLPTLPFDQQRVASELMGLILREQIRYEEALDLYRHYQDDYQAGYCAMLLGDLPNLQKHWNQLLQKHGNHWCLTLYGLVTNELNSYPTLLQIRNHLESDIANFIQAGQLQYLKNLLAHVDELTQFNLESPKLIGRALLYNGKAAEASPYLIKGQKALPNDPEIYFHLGQLSIALGHEREARLMLKQCLLISPTYRPATALLASIPDT